MRAYIATSGFVFLMLAGAHLARVVAEGVGLLREPVFVLTTMSSLLLVIWAAAVWKRLPSNS